MVVAIPTSALAKGVIGVTVQAEDGTVHELSGESDAGDLAASSHVHSAAFRSDPRILMTDPPSGDLGPRFSLLWDLGFAEPLRQIVYPLAEDGPVTYVAPGQRLNGDPTSPINRTFGGWFQADAELTTALESIGFSLEAEEGVVGRLGSGTFLTMAVIAVALVFAATVLMRARRRPLPV